METVDRAVFGIGRIKDYYPQYRGERIGILPYFRNVKPVTDFEGNKVKEAGTIEARLARQGESREALVSYLALLR
ncbi:MAG: hypothetical protein A3G41_04160 [Elusimicrobia bacterium RIFCSPLOWO2_12_FULL_59_9]|nr:MAG: hypothetical protein A3G41_04160 [Elusimicrobia bacterium RIFCSPLOWO2_12_FULL_59_9]